MAATLRIDTKTNLSKADLKAIGASVLPFIILIILSLFVFRVLLGRVNSQRVALSTSRREEIILQEKQELLRELSDDVAPLVEPIAFAIPHKNASLMMIAQVKQQALVRGLFVTNIQTGSAIADGSILRYEIQFDVDGDQTQILDFVSSLSSAAPISRLDALTLSIVGGSSRGEITLSVFTTPLPETLPAITAPITEFSSADLETIARLTSLVPPPFSEVTAQEPGVRENPFD